MAKWIDKAALWAFTALSLYFLILVLTGGSIISATFLTFFLIIFFRSLLRRIPDRRWIRRSEKAACAKELIWSWALMEYDEALNSITQRLPDLIASQKDLRLIQRLPDGVPLDANQLLDIWRSSPDVSSLHLIVTGPVQAEAHALASSLNKPSVRITDSVSLNRTLVKTIREIPEKQKTAGQRRLSKACAARYIQSVRPARTALYTFSFAGLYMFSRSWIHLTAASLMLLLTLIRIVFAHLNKPA